MGLSFLTPLAGLVAVAVILPLVAFTRSEQRAARVRDVLRLAAPAGSNRRTIGAIVVLAVLTGIGAAQPVLEERRDVAARADAQAFFLIDTSRSMLARRDPDSQTRFERARAAALRLRDALPAVPIGIASLTDRAMPHSFPSSNRETFDDVLTLSIGIDKPPSAVAGNTRASSFGALEDVASRNFFRGPARRLLVVLTDAETTRFNDAEVAEAFAETSIETLIVRFWQPGERVFDENGAAEAYEPDPASSRSAEQLASAVGGRAFGEDDLDDAVGAAREVVGRGRVVVRAQETEVEPLGPYAFLAALVPLGFLLYRRNIA